jgi:hypothetical protein
MCDLPSSSLDLALASIRKHARLALHFHPDHPVGSRNVARALLEDGIYKSQWVSNGSVSAHPGGMRDEGERSLRDGASCVEPAHRPKYGALDLMQNSDGPAPRFGSCFFILKPEVSSRSTFTFGGSHLNPKYRGAFHEFHAVLAFMFEECFMPNFALGVSDIRPAQLMERILSLESPLQDPSDGHPSRNLEHLVEAQVHGEVRLDGMLKRWWWTRRSATVTPDEISRLCRQSINSPRAGTTGSECEWRTYHWTSAGQPCRRWPRG